MQPTNYIQNKLGQEASETNGLVSVVLATFNANRDYLQMQLDSLLSQSHPADEIIVCDDNSNDGTDDYITAYALRNSAPIQLIRGKCNLGYSANFLRGLSATQGQYIFLCDQDDVWYQNKIQKIIEAFNSPPFPLVIAHDQMRTKSDLTSYGITTLEAYRRRRLPEDIYVYGCATAFDASLLRLVNCCPETTSYDEWVHLIGRMLGKRHIMPSVFMLFRRHEDSTTTRFNLQRDQKCFSGKGFLDKAKSYNRQWAKQVALSITTLKHLQQVLMGDATRSLDNSMVVKAINSTAANLKLLELRYQILTGPNTEALKYIITGRCYDYRFFGGYPVFTRDVVSRIFGYFDKNIAKNI